MFASILQVYRIFNSVKLENQSNLNLKKHRDLVLPPVQYGNFSYQVPMAIYCLHNSFQFQGAPYWGYNPFHCWRLVSKINFVGSQSNTGQVYSIFKYLKTAIMSLLASLLIPWLLTVECSCQLACILGMSSVKGTLLYA